MLDTTQNTFVGRVTKRFEEKLRDTSQNIETCLFQILDEETVRAHDAGYSKGFINERQVGISEGFCEGNDKGHDSGYRYGYRDGNKKGFTDGKLVGYIEGSHECKIHYEEEYRNLESINGCTLTQREMIRFVEELYEIYLAGKRTGFNKGFLYGVR